MAHSAASLWLRLLVTRGPYTSDIQKRFSITCECWKASVLIWARASGSTLSPPVPCAKEAGMKKRAVTIAAACLKRSTFMEILAFMRILAKLNAYSGGNPRHSGTKKSFSHANCPEVALGEIIFLASVRARDGRERRFRPVATLGAAINLTFVPVDDDPPKRARNSSWPPQYTFLWLSSRRPR